MMQKRFWLLWVLLVACPLQVARADLGFWSSALVGTWRHPRNGDKYRFNSDATYTFWAGAVKRKGGNLSHSGSWKIVQPTARESGGSLEGPVALRLNSTSRVVLEKGVRRTVATNRTFRIVVDTIRHDGEAPENNAYRIGDAIWKRVK